jgi:hypothetical protein
MARGMASPSAGSLRLSALGPVSGRQSDLQVAFGVFLLHRATPKATGSFRSVAAMPNPASSRSAWTRLDARTWRRSHASSRHPQPLSSCRRAAGLPSPLPSLLPQQKRELRRISRTSPASSSFEAAQRRRRRRRGSSEARSRKWGR